MDTQAGLSVAAILNPGTGRQETILSILLKWITIIVFLLIDGHHLVLSALVQSFDVVPIGSAPNISRASLQIVELGTYLFLLAVKISAPILLVVFMVDYGMGILNKIAEQVNVFQLGFQVKPYVSLIVFLAALPVLIPVIESVLDRIAEEIVLLLKALQG